MAPKWRRDAGVMSSPIGDEPADDAEIETELMYERIVAFNRILSAYENEAEPDAGVIARDVLQWVVDGHDDDVVRALIVDVLTDAVDAELRERRAGGTSAGCD
jgi:hypothetical protein